MSLPILHITHEPTREDLIRLFHRTELHWTRHLGEETALDAGTAFVNPELPTVSNANRMLDALLPEDLSPAQAVEQVDEHFRAAGTRCLSWLMNPSAPPGRNAPLEAHLLAHGHRRVPDDIYYLAALARTPVREVAGLKIIPARASYRHARQLAEENSQPQRADARMLHLDDPHTDALLALKDGRPAATISVLAVGELGAISGFFVSAPFRRQGIGRTMMSRALEICARSLFKHVFLAAAPDNLAATSLYGSVGFKKIGEMVAYEAD